MFHPEIHVFTRCFIQVFSDSFSDGIFFIRIFPWIFPWISPAVVVPGDLPVPRLGRRLGGGRRARGLRAAAGAAPRGRGGHAQRRGGAAGGEGRGLATTGGTDSW